MKKGIEMVGIFRVGIYIVLAIFLARLVFLNLVLGGYYEKQASGNRIKKERLEPLRGTITDREGEFLVVNKRIDEKTMRHYPTGEIGASLTGFIGEISEEDLERCGSDCFLGQMVGKTGLEEWYEKELSGTLGWRLVEEDAVGKETREVQRQEPSNGENIRLSVDLGLQRTVYWTIRGAIEMEEENIADGAVVVRKINGEVLALVSLPSFDPNLFIKDGQRGEEGGVYADVASVVSDSVGKPMFNRVVSGMYPPGSVFKLVVATAGLEEGVTDGRKEVEDKGEIKVGGSRFGNWYFDKYGRTEGLVDIKKALARSNDIYFYKLGEWLGVDRIVDWSDKMRVGRRLGIDLPGEAAGFLPSPLWREKKMGERWFLGNTYHLAIGQGDLLVTPLQVSSWTASAVSGKMCEPRLKLGGKTECEDLKISDETKALVMEGMKQACMTGGTAFSFFDLDGSVYCKTGTAQHGGEESLPHAWITVVVPMGDDIGDWIVVTVLLPESGEGSEMAGPVARKIVDYFLD
jgi:penicillin-binding protein 2